MFTAEVDIDIAAANLADIRARAVRFGRPSDSFRFLPGMVTTLGSTEREALERRQQLDELADTREAVGSIAARLGLRSEDLELDEPVPPALRELLPTGPG